MSFFPQPKFQKFGKYVLLDRINVGGMAEVFRAKSFGVDGFARLVAIKRILPNISKEEEFIEMFVDEAKLTVQLQHANVVQVMDLGKVEDRYYISMEYVSGGDLRTVWDRARRRNRLLPIAMSCYLVMKCCEGLDYAHRKKDDTGKDIGLVHRDVSPQNLLVSFEGEVKVVDFGIALARHKVSKSQAGVLKGKFGYMSPEQVRGVELDHRSDIFACGIMLWELLVGDRLFLGESDFSTLEKVRNVEMVPPTHFNKNLSPQVERIVMKALAKNRDDRYRHASEMAEDLQRYLFSSNQPFARTDLQRYMHQHFTEEIAAEQERLDKYRDLNPADFEDPVEKKPSQPPGAGGSAAAFGFAGGSQPDEKVAIARIPTALKPRPVTFSSSPRNSLPPHVSAPNFGAIAIPGDPSLRADASSGQHQPPRDTKKKTTTWIIAGVASVLAAVGVAGVLMLAGRGNGTLSVECTPADVQVFLDDEKVSETTPFVRDLEPRNYVLTVKRAGYRDLVRPIKIVSGQVDAEMLTLEANAGTAAIIVITTPKDLSIWLNGRDTGKKSPATLTPLTAGDYALDLKLDGEGVYNGVLKLADGGAETVTVDISGIPPTLIVDSEAQGAEVWIDGKKIGPAPQTLKTIAPGKVQIQVRKPKCEAAIETIDLKPALTKKVKLTPKCP